MNQHLSHSQEKNLIIYDTTLRDGEQAPGNSMSLAQKLWLFEMLDKLGMHYIDIGFPSANDTDFQFCQKLTKLNKHCRLSALARANQADIKRTAEAFEGTEENQIQILLLGSEIHVNKKRNISVKEAIDEAKQAIQYAKHLGINDISVALEDATRASHDFLYDMIYASVDKGARTIVIPDTVGAMIPEEIYALIQCIRGWVGDEITLSVHCHNDMGLATANTLAALDASVDCIQTTLCGIGERAGNAALEEILTVLHYKYEQFHIKHKVDLKQLYLACKALIQMLHLNVGKHKPIVGDNAFSTAAGIHIHGLMKDPSVYEFIQAKDFGLTQHFVINKHAGRSAIKERLHKLGLDTDPTKVEMILFQIKNAEYSEIYNDDLTLLKLYHKLSHMDADRIVH